MVRNDAGWDGRQFITLHPPAGSCGSCSTSDLQPVYRNSYYSEWVSRNTQQTAKYVRASLPEACNLEPGVHLEALEFLSLLLWIPSQSRNSHSPHKNSIRKQESFWHPTAPSLGRLSADCSGVGPGFWVSAPWTTPAPYPTGSPAQTRGMRWCHLSPAMECPSMWAMTPPPELLWSLSRRSINPCLGQLSNRTFPGHRRNQRNANPSKIQPNQPLEGRIPQTEPMVLQDVPSPGLAPNPSLQTKVQLESSLTCLTAPLPAG